jgi:metal-dependent hydrolase (beta-lactamase superfamily II)
MKERPLYAIMAGFHLTGPIFEPLIPRVLDNLGALARSVVVPAHYTGWLAQHAMGARLARRSSRTPSARASKSDSFGWAHHRP